MLVLTNINLKQNELQNVVLHPLAVAPSNPKLYQIYTDSTDGKIKQWTGTAWVTVGMIVEASANNGKIKVDGTDVTVYTLPTAASNVLGGIKIGSGLNINDGVVSVDWASPNMSGTPTAPTAASGTNTTQIATTAFVQTAIGGLALISISVVNALPETGTANVIYLVPKTTSGTNNAYDEYIWVTSSSAYEKIGDTTIDLSGYLTTSGNASSTTVAFTAAGSRALPATGETMAVLFGKVLKYLTDLSTAAFSGSYSDLSNKPTLPSVDTATMTTSQTTKSITATGTTVANVLVVDSVTHEQVLADVSINGTSVTVTVAAAPTNALTITVLSI